MSKKNPTRRRHARMVLMQARAHQKTGGVGVREEQLRGTVAFDTPQRRTAENWEEFKGKLFDPCVPPYIGRFMSWGEHGVIVSPNGAVCDLPDGSKQVGHVMRINPPPCVNPKICRDHCVEWYIWQHLRESIGTLPDDPKSLVVISDNVAALRGLIDHCDRVWRNCVPKLFGPIDHAVMTSRRPVGNA